MTDLPARLHAVRARLGQPLVRRPLSLREMADAIGMGGDNAADDLLKMEAGKRKITGPIERLIEAYEAGYVPAQVLAISREKGHSRLRVKVSDEDIFAAVARHAGRRGARVEAARELGISASVVTRRMNAMGGD